MYPDVSKGHPRNNVWNVERDDYVNENKNSFSLLAIEWYDEGTQTVFHCRDKQLIDLSNGGRSPDQSNVEIQSTLAECCFVAYRLDDGVPSIDCEAHYCRSRRLTKNVQDVS